MTTRDPVCTIAYHPGKLRALFADSGRLYVARLPIISRTPDLDERLSEREGSVEVDDRRSTISNGSRKRRTFNAAARDGFDCNSES